MAKTCKPTWKELRDHRDWASDQGEAIAKAFECVKPPVDPLWICRQEPAIFVKGANLGEKLDGRLSYCRARSRTQRDRYVLAYNTRYDAICEHDGDHCPRVRFTVGHELAHYFIERHRAYLRRGGRPYACLTESYSEMVIELEADAFAAGLLMPSYLFASIVNRDIGELSKLAQVQNVAREFRTSLTSTMVRWTRVSDFPCAVFSVAEDAGRLGIRWGWVSEAFAAVGAYWRRYGEFRSAQARAFVGLDTSMSTWRSGSGMGLLGDWVDTDHRVSVTEYYAVIPYAKHLLVFITAPEDELDGCRQEWEE